MSSKKSAKKGAGHQAEREVVFLNPQTCGIYKNGGVRYKTDASTGKRTKEVDNQLADVVEAYLRGKKSDAITRKPLKLAFDREVLVPRYFDDRWNYPIREFSRKHKVQTISIGQLLKQGVIRVTGGHGSPSNDQRTGHIPYVKVSDIRSLRMNINPTNLVSRAIAETFWGETTSGLAGWDLVTPNRASSNIGEFAVILPGEEQVVLTKEVYVVRVIGDPKEGWDPFYLLWAFCLTAVRRQWQRVTLMQTNREDCGDRYLEVRLPVPPNAKWAAEISAPFREYFTSLAKAKAAFTETLKDSKFDFIANVKTGGLVDENSEQDETPVVNEGSLL